MHLVAAYVAVYVAAYGTVYVAVYVAYCDDQMGWLWHLSQKQAGRKREKSKRKTCYLNLCDHSDAILSCYRPSRLFQQGEASVHVSAKQFRNLK